MATPLEKDIERHLTRAVGDLGGHCLKWVCPGWSGIPDRIVLLPGGRIFFVELKRPDGGHISRLQAEWHQRLRKLGFVTVFIKTHEEVNKFLTTANNTERISYRTHPCYTGYAFREEKSDDNKSD